MRKAAKAQNNSISGNPFLLTKSTSSGGIPPINIGDVQLHKQGVSDDVMEDETSEGNHLEKSSSERDVFSRLANTTGRRRLAQGLSPRRVSNGDLRDPEAL